MHTGHLPGVHRLNMNEKTYGSKKMFFYNGKLYRKLKKDKGNNMIFAWDYKNNSRVVFDYADWKRNCKKAFSTNEACEILDRHRTKIYLWLRAGLVREPICIGPGERTHEITNRHRYWWSEEDLMAVHDFMVERIKAGGNFNTFPSKEEIRQKISDDETVIYTKTKDGKYVVTYRAT